MRGRARPAHAVHLGSEAEGFVERERVAVEGANVQLDAFAAEGSRAGGCGVHQSSAYAATARLRADRERVDEDETSRGTQGMARAAFVGHDRVAEEFMLPLGREDRRVLCIEEIRESSPNGPVRGLSVPMRLRLHVEVVNLRLQPEQGVDVGDGGGSDLHDVVC